MLLVTGASGFIGLHFLQRASKIFKIRCLVRPSSSAKLSGFNGLDITEGDLLSETDITKAVQGVDTVLHLGALLRTKKPDEVRRVNIEGTRMLVEAAKKEGVRRFIFVSSENALREDLVDAYAVSKREAEKSVGGLDNHLILRPCFVYGPGDDHGLGRLIELIEKSPLAPHFPNLKSQIQPIYIDDTVEYLIRALQKDIHGAYILAGSEKINLNVFLKRACKVKNKRRLFIPVPPFFLNRAQRNNIYHSRTYAIEKTVADFGHSPITVDEGLRLWFGSGLAANKRL